MLWQIKVKRNNMNYLNAFKLQRATAWAKANGKENDDEAIKAKYLELGGAIEGEVTEEKKPEEVKPEPAIEKPVERVVRRRRSAK